MKRVPMTLPLPGTNRFGQLEFYTPMSPDEFEEFKDMLIRLLDIYEPSIVAHDLAPGTNGDGI